METLRAMIKRHEGWRDRPYLCSAGHRTIGYGWNLDANPLPDDIAAYLNRHGCILPEHGERLLTIAIGAATFQCHMLCPAFNTFSQERQNALVDFVFNVGLGTAKKFVKATTAINAGDWGKAAEEMKDSLWYHQVGARADDIIDMIKGRDV